MAVEFYLGYEKDGATVISSANAINVCHVDRTNCGYQQPGEYPIHTKEDYEDTKVTGTPVDALPIIVDLLIDKLGLDPDNMSAADYNSMKGEVIFIYDTTSPSSKTNMCIYIKNVDAGFWAGKAFTLFVGDMTHGVGWTHYCYLDPAGTSYESGLYFLTQYNGDNSISSLSALVLAEIETYTSDANLSRWMTSPQYAIFAPAVYIQSTGHYWINYSKNWLDGMCQFAANLQHWYNWYLMVTGEYYNQEYTLAIALDEPVERPWATIDHIDIAFPIANGRSTYDPGNELSTTVDNVEYPYIALGYYVNGTQLTSLFDVTNAANAHDEILLESGCAIYRDIVNSVAYYKLVSPDLEDEPGFAVEFSQNSYEDFQDAGSDYIAFGCQLCVPASWLEYAYSAWIDQIAADYDTYVYDNSPLCLMTYSTQYKFCQPDYYDATTYPNGFAPGLVYNLKAASNSNRCLEYPMTITKAFWGQLLSGIRPPAPEPPHWDNGRGNPGSASQGGHGTVDDTSDTISVPSVPSGIGNFGTAFALWNVSANVVNSLLTWLNNTTVSEQLSDPDRTALLGNIANLTMLYLPNGVSLNYSNAEMYVGGRDTGTRGNMMINTVIGADFGYIDLAPYFDSFLDFAPYTAISLYLPFAGVTEIDTNIFMGGRIRLSCRVDLISGDVIWLVSSEKDGVSAVVYEMTGNCSASIPLSAKDFSTRLSGVAKEVGSALAAAAGLVIADVATAGTTALAGAAMAISEGGKALTQKAKNRVPMPIKRAGDPSYDIGMASVLYPYLIITRPIMSLPDTYAHDVGYKCDFSSRLGDLEGFTIVTACHLDGISDATSDDLQEIDKLLHSGIIL